MTLILAILAPTWTLAQSTGIAEMMSNRASSFRPTPLRGQSQIRGRSLGLREQMQQNRIFLMSPATDSVPSIDAVRQRALQARARIRAAQARSSLQTAQSLRQATSAARRNPTSQVSHIIELAIDPIPVSQKFQTARNDSRSRRFESLRNQLDLPDLDVQVIGSRAILDGSVRDQRQSRILEQIVRMEPGIDSVENQLRVQE